MLYPCRAWRASIRSRSAVADRGPVAPGHVRVAVRRHVADFLDTTPDEQQALLALLRDAKRCVVWVRLGNTRRANLIAHLETLWPQLLDPPRQGRRQVGVDEILHGKPKQAGCRTGWSGWAAAY